MFLAAIFNGVVIYIYFLSTGGTQSGATKFNNVLEQVIEEAIEACCYGDGLTDGEGLLIIWDTAVGGSLVQLLGKKIVVLRR